MTNHKSDRRQELLNALATIKDPELGLDLVSLGLIYETRMEGASAHVRLTLTTPGCPLAGTIIEDVRAALRFLPGVHDVSVDLTFDPPWTPDRMSHEARAALGMISPRTA